jgi:hypothetical protein
MKEFILRQFPTLRTHGKLFVAILFLAQTVIIGLMLLANANLHAVYNESVDDNVKLFMDNYELRMKQQKCAPEEQDENSDEVPQTGFIRV